MRTKDLIFDVPYVIIGSELNTLDRTETFPIDVFFMPNIGSTRNIIPARGITLHHSIDVFSSRCQSCRLVAYKQSDRTMTQITLPNFGESSRNTPIITINNGYATTTSRNVAIVFGKRHDKVLDAIRNLRTEAPTEFSERNFPLSYYNNSQGKRQPMYELTRDGFTLLAMGFTGKRALEFKLAYINAFNEMERKLAEPKKDLTSDTKNETIGSEIQTSELAATLPKGVFFIPVCWERANILNKHNPSTRVFETPSAYPADRYIQTKELKMTQLPLIPDTGKISTYNFNNNTVRIDTVNGEPWFNLNDCCAALDIKYSSRAKSRLNQKGVRQTHTPTKGGQQSMTYINEPNMYRLVLRSDKPSAEPFIEWVTGEVLPSIRKTGKYQIEPKTITVKSHTRRISRKSTQKALPTPATDNVRGDFLYEKMKLMVVASEFFDKAADVADRTQRLSMAVDCVSSAYRITNQIKGVR